MANTQGIGAVAKQVALAAIVDGKSISAALYLVTATKDGTTAYSTTGELAATGGYTQLGKTVTNGNTAGLTGSTAYWTPSASIQWTSFTSSGAFDAVMLVSTTDANRNLGVFTFGSQSVTSGTFTLTMPTNDSSTGLIRFT
jgi:hypothetical protein